MKYIAGSILYVAGAIFAQTARSQETLLLVCYLGFGLICLGIMEDFVTFIITPIKRDKNPDS